MQKILRDTLALVEFKEIGWTRRAQKMLLPTTSYLCRFEQIHEFLPFQDTVVFHVRWDGEFALPLEANGRVHFKVLTDNIEKSCFLDVL